MYLYSLFLVHNKIRVVRRQVPNRRNSRLNRLLTAHKRQSNKDVHTVGSTTAKKVIEPYMKPVYGAVPDTTALSTSPEHGGNNENQPLLK